MTQENTVQPSLASVESRDKDKGSESKAMPFGGSSGPSGSSNTFDKSSAASAGFFSKPDRGKGQGRRIGTEDREEAAPNEKESIKISSKT